MTALGETVSVAGVIVAAGIIFVALFWVALAFHVVRDARRRSTSKSFQLLATLLGFVPPFFGAVIYLMVRPPQTLDEERALALEERAFLDPAGDEPPRPCPNCGRDIDTDFIVCPYCCTQFARRCGSCSRNLRLGWSVCPYCAEEIGVHALSRSTRAAGR